MSKTLKAILTLILTIAVLQGALLGFLRYQIEQENKTVELVSDYADLEKIAALSKSPLSKILKDIKKQGITSIALLEQTPAQASADGELYFASGAGILSNRGLSPFLKSYADRGLIAKDKTYFLIKDPAVRKRVLNHLEASFSNKKIKFLGRSIIEIDENVSEIRNLGIGFSERVLSQVAGFRIIPRLANEQKYNIEKKIALLKGLDTIVFEGEEILGHPNKIPVLAEALKNNGINYGYVEIIKQFGNTELKKSMGNHTIRVHGISQDELKKTDPKVAIDRFIRAAKERGIRMLYIRPYLKTQSFDIEYFSSIRSGIKKAGFRIGKASSPQEFNLTKQPIIILGLGTAVGLILLLNAFFKLNLISILTILFFSFFALYFYNSPDLILQQLIALAAAIIFPAIAIINSFKKAASFKNIYINAAVIVVNVFAEALIGVLIIVGILCDSRFILGAFSFRGIKFALVLPILIVASYFLIKGDDQELDYKKTKDKITSFLKTNIPVIYILLTAVGLGIGFILLARSGNFIIPVLKGEKVLRSILENLLIVRPRFKEFMIGYPALFLSAVLFIRGERKWLWLMLAIGALAPVTFINSFCHTHTPLMVSIIRSINGLVIGTIIGFILGFAINWGRRDRS
ncbi:MAG: hypothetical protein HQ564_00830 [Candidatus Saganbacteria bacterium]|nr:hypothetical protein [Candidatus Saganbacteria bacterium]